MAAIRKRVLPSGRVAWLVDFKDQNGRRRARQFQTKRQADAFMVEARARVAQGQYVHDPDSATVGGAISTWLVYCARRRQAGQRMERATYRDYEGKLRLHVLDPDVGIGSIKLSRLTRKAICEFRDRLLESGRSAAMVRKILGCLSLVLKHAQENGMISVNPVDGVRVIRDSRVEQGIQIPDKGCIRTLMENASESFRPLLAVTVLCGLRASETRSLCWPDIDFDEGFIHVRRRADAFKELGEPKSAASLRAVPMGPYVSNILKQWKLYPDSSQTRNSSGNPAANRFFAGS